MKYSPADMDSWMRTVWGEARGESFLGKIAVAWVIRRRADADLGNDGKPDWWGESIYGVCHATKQFSCWNPSDPNFSAVRSVTINDPAALECLAACYLVANDLFPDPTAGATHYYARSITAPGWAKVATFCAAIDSHLFYRNVA